MKKNDGLSQIIEKMDTINMKMGEVSKNINEIKHYVEKVEIERFFKQLDDSANSINTTNSKNTANLIKAINRKK